MADPAERLSENVEGDFFVDSSCIDCETCMIVAPEIFGESSRNLSFVHQQPRTEAQVKRAMMALISCPTASIGSLSGQSSREAAHAFPEEILPGVFYLGYASEDSYGASSWLIRRPEGNVLVDSPRAARPLLNGIAKLGGARLLFLTHRDDVADHVKLRAAFGCERVMMRDDSMGMECERRLDGTEPIPLADDLLVIPVPGHTRGSAALLFRNEILFTGDHLWGDAEGHLAASRGVAWHSWSEQKKSMARLKEFPFSTVLPGHGRPWLGHSKDEAAAELDRLLARMR